MQRARLRRAHAAESGDMAPRRYESYRRLRRLYEDLTEARGPGRKN